MTDQAPMSGPVIETRGLVKRYDDQLAVAGIDLWVGPGEIYGLVGPNGAGKTTTMRILATLLAPSAGEALVCGIPVTEDPIEGAPPDRVHAGLLRRVRRPARLGYLDFFGRCYAWGPTGAAHDRRAARNVGSPTGHAK